MEARLRRSGALAIVVTVALASGCGGKDEPRGTDLTTVRCPQTASGKPAPGSFDTAELIGLALDDARARAGDHGCEVVVAMKDGEGVPVPIEVDPKRIYVYTEDGVVTKIEGVGGGI
jgi:hypothetical protein